MITKFDDYKLCLIMDNWAYFTTQDLDKQWGDGWRRIPYSDNADEPYTCDNSEWDILKVGYDSPILEPPCEYAYNEYSVQMINNGSVAWLTVRSLLDKCINIYAGDTVWQFVNWIYASGGEVYFSLEVHKELLEIVRKVAGHTSQLALVLDATMLGEFQVGKKVD